LANQSEAKHKHKCPVNISSAHCGCAISVPIPSPQNATKTTQYRTFFPGASRLVDNVEDSGTSEDVLVGDGGDSTGGEESVCLTVEKALRDNGSDSLATIDNLSVSEDGSSDLGEGNLGLAGEGAGLKCEGDGRARSDWASVGLGVHIGAVDGCNTVGEGEDGKSLDREGWVALGARADELGSERVDLVEVEGGVEGSRERRESASGLGAGTDVAGVTRLDGQDGASGLKVGGCRNVLSSTQVGGDTNTLENVCSGDERLD